MTTATLNRAEGPQELVYVGNESRAYHRRWHGRRGYVVTWTREFAETGLDLTPCRVCYRASPSTTQDVR